GDRGAGDADRSLRGHPAHRFPVRPPGYYRMDAQLGPPRLEDRRRRPGEEPRPVGTPARRHRPPLHRLALGEGAFRRSRQRARGRPGAQRSHEIPEPLMRQIVLDTETTGLDWRSKRNRIVEIGCVELVERRPSGRTWHRYIHPEREFEAGAQEVTGLTL